MLVTVLKLWLGVVKENVAISFCLKSSFAWISFLIFLVTLMPSEQL